MNREDLIKLMKIRWREWEDSVIEETVDIVLNDYPEFANNFEGIGWQEQDQILNVLKAIRG